MTSVDSLTDASREDQGERTTRPTRTQGSVVLRNVSLNFVSQVWFTVLALVTTPYIANQLGPSLYGLYVLIAAILGYFAFLDLGLGAALTKYVAQYDAVDDREALS